MATQAHDHGTQPFSTLLPREIRDMIYHELWSLSPILDGVKPMQGYCFKVTVVYNTASRRDAQGSLIPSTHLPRWLLTCKEFLEEGLQQLQGHGRWVILYSERLTQHSAGIPNCGLLSPAKARAMSLTFLNIYSTIEWNGEDESQVRLYVGLERPHNVIWGYLLEKLRDQHSVTELKLVFTREYVDELDELEIEEFNPVACEFNLSGFTFIGFVFPKLKRLEIEILDYRRSTFVNQRITAMYKNSLQRALIRLAGMALHGACKCTVKSIEGSNPGQPRKWLWVFTPKGDASSG